MSIKNIAVLGAGNGGFAASADLTQRGFSVNLFEHPRFAENIEEVKKKGGIYTKGDIEEGFVKLNRITSNIESALDGVEMVILIMPAFGIEAFAEHCIPYLKDGQMVVLNMGATQGALLFRGKIKEMAPKLQIKVGETASLTYGCRRTGPTEATIHVRVRKNLLFSAFPAKDTPELIEAFRSLYPCVIPATNVLETGLNNGNPLLHPLVTVLNAGQIEFLKGEFYFYRDGMSPSVARVVEALDRERMDLCRALGFRETPSKERAVNYGYVESRETLYGQFRTSNTFMNLKGPANFQERFLTEDIPFGLVFWASLGRSVGSSTPIINALIDIGAILAEKNFRKEGLTLEKLGLGGLSKSQLLQYMMTGEKEFQN